METTAGISVITDAMSTAFTQVNTDVLPVIAVAVTAGLVVFGAFACVRIGIKSYKLVTGKV